MKNVLFVATAIAVTQSAHAQTNPENCKVGVLPSVLTLGIPLAGGSVVKPYLDLAVMDDKITSYGVVCSEENTIPNIIPTTTVGEKYTLKVEKNGKYVITTNLEDLTTTSLVELFCIKLEDGNVKTVRAETNNTKEDKIDFSNLIVTVQDDDNTITLNGTVNSDETITRFAVNGEHIEIDSSEYTFNEDIFEGKTAYITPIPNQAPIANSDTSIVNSGETTIIDVLANDTDADNDALSISGISTNPSQGTVEIIDGKIHYTANADASGSDSFSYITTDENGGYSTAQVTISINTPAEFSGDINGTITNGDDPISGTLTVTDKDGGNEADVIAESFTGNFGDFSIDTNGNWTYAETSDLADGQNGTDTFTITTEGGDSTGITVSIVGHDTSGGGGSE